MKKSDAEQRWCPYAIGEGKLHRERFNGRVSGYTLAITNHNRNANGSPKDDCKCITSKCMAWVELTTEEGFCAALDDNMQR